jgi:hypothetical protein
LDTLRVFAVALRVLRETFQFKSGTEHHLGGQFAVAVLEVCVALELTGQVLVQNFTRASHYAV